MAFVPGGLPLTAICLLSTAHLAKLLGKVVVIYTKLGEQQLILGIRLGALQAEHSQDELGTFSPAIS
jgi:hypothetical protein